MTVFPHLVHYLTRSSAERLGNKDKNYLVRHLPWVGPLHSLQAIRVWFPLGFRIF